MPGGVEWDISLRRMEDVTEDHLAMHSRFLGPGRKGWVWCDEKHGLPVPPGREVFMDPEVEDDRAVKFYRDTGRNALKKEDISWN